MKDIAKTTKKISLCKKAKQDDALPINVIFIPNFKDYLEIKCNDRINFE